MLYGIVLTFMGFRGFQEGLGAQTLQTQDLMGLMGLKEGLVPINVQHQFLCAPTTKEEKLETFHKDQRRKAKNN